MSETIETPLPASVRNHWWWRPGWREGRHFHACHLTLDDQPQLRELVADYQQALTGMTGIDLIPPQWLHLTVQGIGFTDEISAAELVALDHALAAELGTINPPTVEFRYLTVYPEAIYRDGEAEPIAATLDSLDTRPVKVTFAKADLLEFHRDRRMYEWTSATPIPIGSLNR